MVYSQFFSSDKFNITDVCKQLFQLKNLVSQQVIILQKIQIRTVFAI